MKSTELIDAIRSCGKRMAIVGTETDGVVIVLDMEGRVFTFMDGEVLSRVNMDAITGISTKETYINPGGDGLWPAPEGTDLGYEYSTGAWRVPPSLTAAQWIPVEQEEGRALFQAEVDLINARGLGLPFLMCRDIRVTRSGNALTVSKIESMQYLGNREYTREEAVAAPWSLCQFDCNADCTLRLHKPGAESIWDLYQWDSSCHWHDNNGTCDVDMVTDFRFQLGMSPDVEWLEFIDKSRGFSVKRTADMIPYDCEYIDIADRDPSVKYNGDKAIRFSAYCDPSGFMEIEAAGGTPVRMVPGAWTNVTINDIYTRL